jgi:hypothetical protein
MKFKIFVLIFLISYLTISKCLSTNNFKQDTLVSQNDTKLTNSTKNFTHENNKTQLSVHHYSKTANSTNSTHHIHNNSNQTHSKNETHKHLHKNKTNFINSTLEHHSNKLANSNSTNQHHSSNQSHSSNKTHEHDHYHSANKTQFSNSTHNDKHSNVNQTKYVNSTNYNNTSNISNKTKSLFLSNSTQIHSTNSNIQVNVNVSISHKEKPVDQIKKSSANSTDSQIVNTQPREQLVKSPIKKSNLNKQSQSTQSAQSVPTSSPESQEQILNSQDSQVETIVEVPVTYSTGITYYYPYFYKTHLITFPENSNYFFSQSDLTDTMPTCAENCLLCTASNSAQCLRCSSGYYLDEGKCVEYCPEGKLADILRAKCLSREFSANLDVVYTMAYSVGSCSNMCGKMVQDCSCAPSCKSRGNCCTNYDVVNCDFIIEKSSKTDEQKCKDAGCALCEEKDNSLKCSQCPDDKFLFNGTCVDTCPEGFSANSINKVCNKDELSKKKSTSNKNFFN